MTANEKRAHDIALRYADMIVKYQMEQQLDSEPVNGKIEVSTDYYMEYKKAYAKAIESVNKDFN